MAQPLAQPAEVVDLSATSETATRALFRTGRVEMIRLVLAGGKTIPSHRAPGELVVQCLAGRVRFTAMGRTVELGPGQLLYLPEAETHEVHAAEPSQLLLTIIGPGKAASPAVG